jgi:hypothetical protein
MEDQMTTPQSPGQRASAYWFIDGLPLIVSGAEFALWGALGVWSLLDSRMRVPAFFLGSQLAFFGAVLGFDRHFTEILKRRITYPRTGYVNPPMSEERYRLAPGFTRNLEPLAEPLSSSLRLGERPLQSENLTRFHRLTLMVLFGASVTANMCREFHSVVDSPWMLPSALLATAVTLFVTNRDIGPRYRWWSLALLPLAGLALAPFEFRLGIRVQLVPLICGLWLAGEGAATLFRYLRKYPRPQAGLEVHA